MTAYNYAFQLSQIPVGVLGVSVAVALFPTLIRDAALGRVSRDPAARLPTSLRVLIFLAAPLTAVMIVLARPIAAVFFQYGLFSARSAERTAGALVFFAIGLVGHIVVHVLTRAFYAMQDTRTPVTWAIIAVAINVPLMVAAVGPMGVQGLALALSISAVAGGHRPGVGAAPAHRLRGGGDVLRSRGALGLAAVAAGLLMLGGLTAVRDVLPGPWRDGLGRLLALAVLIGRPGSSTCSVASALRAPEIDRSDPARAAVRRGAAHDPRSAGDRQPTPMPGRLFWPRPPPAISCTTGPGPMSPPSTASPSDASSREDDGDSSRSSRPRSAGLPLRRSFWYVHTARFSTTTRSSRRAAAGAGIGLREAARRDARSP